MNLRKSSNLQN